MIVVGISAYFHDSAAALVRDGEIIAAAQEERFTRRKHDASLPINAVRFCLRQAGVRIEDVDHVVFYEKPLRKFERLLITHLREFPRGLPQFSRAMATWLGKRLWLKGEICPALGCAPEQLLFSDHHLSHAASAFLCSPFERAAIITVDGVGEWATTSIYRGVSGPSGSRIELLRELHFPHSIGLLYSAITAYLGFEVNEGEYKVMGLASYGRPLHLKAFEQMCTIDEDAALSIDPRYFCYQRDAEKSFTPALEALLGPARAPGAPLPQRYADVAASLQAFTERYMLALVAEARRETGEDHACLAGGVALNCVANRRIQDAGPFSGVFVQPAAGDAGGALGAALWATHVIEKLPRRAPLRHAFLGEGHDPKAIERFLDDCGIAHRVFSDETALDDEVCRRLCEGQVGGWFKGRFEWGPRALGARSIIADPRPADMRDRVNAKIKFRERFRPFAPAVLRDEAPRWFGGDAAREDHLAPFMCTVMNATEEAKQRLPAVVHIDGTSRAQYVDAESSPAFHRLLERFRQHTGIGVILNTSMNLKDEPIVASPAEAYATFIRSELDFLVLERCLIEKERSA